MPNKNRDETKELRAKSAERRVKMKMSYTLSADDFNSVIGAKKREKKVSKKAGDST